MPDPASATIAPQLRVFDLTMIVAGLVIGMGIFRVPPEVAREAGVPLVFFGAWITGAIVSAIGALTFAEIGSRYPVAGGFYKIFSHCYHPAFAFMVNWIVVLSNAGAMAAVAIMGAEYIAPILLPQLAHDGAITVITVSSILILYLINLRGIRTGAMLMNALMVVKLGLLAVLIAAVFVVEPAPPAHSQPLETGSMMKAFLLCFIPIFFSYGGYQQTINFGRDIAQARRTLPRAIIGGMAIILIVYLSVNYSFYRILGLPGLAGSTTVATDIVAKLAGPVASKLVAILMFFSVMAYVNVGLMSNPRVYFAMAEDGILPPVFKRVNPKTQVQEAALSFFCAAILLTLFFISSFQKILAQVMFFDSIGFITAAASIFILRRRARREANGPDVFRMPGYPYLPVLFILVYAGVNISVFYANPMATAWGIALFVAGLPMYYLIQRMLRRRVESGG